jgi:hypothetical protein
MDGLRCSVRGNDARDGLCGLVALKHFSGALAMHAREYVKCACIQPYLMKMARWGGRALAAVKACI